LVLIVAVSANTVYVNFQTGNDANTGTQSGPVKTIQRATELIVGPIATIYLGQKSNKLSDGTILETGNCGITITAPFQVILRSAVRASTGLAVYCPTTPEFGVSFEGPSAVTVKKINWHGPPVGVSARLPAKSVTLDFVGFTSCPVALRVSTVDKVTITNCVLSQVSPSSGSALAVIVNPGGSVSISTTTVSGQISGGQIFLIRTISGTGTFNLASTTFSSISGVSTGVRVADMATTIGAGVVFNGVNTAHSAYEQFGGSLTATGTQFTNIAGTLGAAMDLSGCTSVTLNTISYNTITGTIFGAVHTRDVPSVTVNTCTFSSVTATGSGGALSVFQGALPGIQLQVTGSTFTSCTGAKNGGAIYAVGGFQAQETNAAAVSITGSTFTGNSATTNGDAIYLTEFGTGSALSNNHFHDNGATGSGRTAIYIRTVGGDLSIGNNDFCLSNACTDFHDFIKGTFTDAGGNVCTCP